MCLSFLVIYFHPFSVIFDTNLSPVFDHTILFDYAFIIFHCFTFYTNNVHIIRQHFYNSMTAWRHFYRHHYNHLLPPYFLPSPKAFFIRHIHTHFDIVPFFLEWSFNKPWGNLVVGIIKVVVTINIVSCDICLSSCFND